MNILDRADLRSRYRITGRLVMDTALHIGGGHESSPITDSPVVKDATGEPLIPGSSFKGAFRAAVERLGPMLGMRTCQLAEDFPHCLSTDRSLSEDYQVVRQQLGRELRDDANGNTLKAIQALKEAATKLAPTSPLLQTDWIDWIGKTITEEHLLGLLDALLCETCKTFGSVHLASVAFFHDLPLDGPWYDAFEVRDGVGIDRDSERAKDQVKFDYEIVPPQTAFLFSLTLENPRDADLALVALGLKEFLEGMVPIGGIRSRGLGRCHLAVLKVAWVDFTSDQARKEYLVTGKMSQEDGDTFIARYVAALAGA